MTSKKSENNNVIKRLYKTKKNNKYYMSLKMTITLDASEVARIIKQHLESEGYTLQSDITFKLAQGVYEKYFDAISVDVIKTPPNNEV